MIDSPFFLNHDCGNIFCFRHQSKQSGKSAGIVICSPHAEEKLNSHRILYNLSNDLSKKGFDCLRFDFFGHGDSEGSFNELTIASMEEDILCCIDFYKSEGFKHVILLGVRLGATIAAIASQKKGVDGLICINPIFNMKKYIEECLRGNLSSQVIKYKKVVKSSKILIEEIKRGETIRYYGYEMTNPFLNQALLIDTRSIIERLEKKILFIDIKPKKRLPEIKEFINDHKWIAYSTLEGSSFWQNARYFKEKEDKMTAHIVTWLQSTLK